MKYKPLILLLAVVLIMNTVIAQEVCTTPLDVMLVIDRSGSMVTPNPARFQNAKDAAILFLDSMDFNQDRAGLASFASAGSLDQILTSVKNNVVVDINALSAGGVTYMGDGIKLATMELVDNGIHAPVMIILSDGASNVYPGGFCVVEPTSPTLCTDYSYDQSVIAKDAGINVFTIGLGVSAFTESRLKLIASSEDNYFFAPNSSALSSIYSSIAEVICPCGDGDLDEGEECDDGNLINGDGCTEQCILEYCSDGTINNGPPGGPGEECDDGNLINGDGCNQFCEEEECGNGVVDAGEQCDDGNENENDQCSNECTWTLCGDLFVQDPNGLNESEQCDDGAFNGDGDECTNECQLTFCGDTIEQSPNGLGTGGPLNNGFEDCDDGANGISTDLCTDSCVYTFCGDNFVQDPNGEGLGGPLNDGVEECDDGLAGSNQCTPNCEETYCGDGFVQNPNGEGTGGPLNDGDEDCDDGNDINTDDCVDECIDAECGDGYVHAGVEECDDGGTTPGDGCNEVCEQEECGNGVVDVGEACDDGNDIETDTCSSSCEWTFCGDLITQNPNGFEQTEECDDGQNGDDTDGCTDSCELTYCGDSTVQSPNGELSDGPFDDGYEDCDDGANGFNNDLCTDTCVYTYCGDTVIQNPNGEGTLGLTGIGDEECDDGQTGGDLDQCTDSCTKTYCGDLVTQSPNGFGQTEECDDGANGFNNDLCTDTCTLTFCGDSVTQNPNGYEQSEECDDGADGDNTDQCTDSCTLTFCGDSVTQSLNGYSEIEECDDGQNGDDTDGCTDSCTLTYCGDTITQNPNGEGTLGKTGVGDEECDDGQTGGDLDECTDECALTYCGDSVTQTLNGFLQNEECDDGADGDDTDGCTDQCLLTYCGDSITQDPNGYEQSEECDDGQNGDDTDGCTDECTLTYCGDTVTQNPNGVGSLGLTGVGDEQCDDGQTGGSLDQCTDSCTYTYCGDGIKQDPNGYGESEECDDLDGVPENYVCFECALYKIPECDDIGYIDPYHNNLTVEWIDTLSLVNITEDGEDVCANPDDLAETYYIDNYLDGAEFEFFCETEDGCAQWEDFKSDYDDPDWTRYEGNFPAGEESCHVIETYTELLGIKSEITWDCVYVDKSPPDPVKVVGKPRSEWDGADLDGGNPYYPEAPEHCETNDCWKVTIMTPITMSCEDPEPHPSGENFLCFMADFDGQDITESMCEGIYNYTGDGSCCSFEDEVELYFEQTSYHKLSFYCEDNVQKRSEPDVEYFKVEDSKFEIDLNFKWNLISIPVVLLDDSVKNVFSDIEDSILSVWGYDAVTDEWSVYTPDGNDGNDNLEHLIPGRGYWVLTNQSDTLVIGGSLLMPAVTPPSVAIKGNAWNLIGYYGLDGQLGYFGPAGNGDQAECHLASIDESVTGWSALYGYWEPNNPNQWFGLSEFDYLDPGAGYWLFAQDGDVYYSPSTVCTNEV